MARLKGHPAEPTRAMSTRPASCPQNTGCVCVAQLKPGKEIKRGATLSAQAVFAITIGPPWPVPPPDPVLPPGLPHRFAGRVRRCDYPLHAQGARESPLAWCGNACTFELQPFSPFPSQPPTMPVRTGQRDPRQRCREDPVLPVAIARGQDPQPGRRAGRKRARCSEMSCVHVGLGCGVWGVVGGGGGG